MESNVYNDLPSDYHIEYNGKKLTLIDLQIISLSIHGLTRDQITVTLKKGRTTIDTHFTRIFDRMGIKTVQEMTAEAAYTGFDRQGNYKNIYLFGTLTGLPWQKKNGDGTDAKSYAPAPY
ncbi:MAG: hypothetical protein K9G41_12005 [Flavobacteriales bacterium]|nr:hypothetical protein [Flavobacteriales bacterium]